MTFISQAAPNSTAPTRDEVVAAMEEIVRAPVLPGTVERSREAVVIDIPATQGKQIAEVRRTDPHTLCTQLSPPACCSSPVWYDEQQSSMGETVAARTMRAGLTSLNTTFTPLNTQQRSLLTPSNLW